MLVSNIGRLSEQIRNELNKADLDGLLLFSPVNIGYLLGSEHIEKGSCYLLFAKEKLYVLSFEMYRVYFEELLNDIHGTELVILNPKYRLTDFLSTELKSSVTIGFEDNNISYFDYQQLSKRIDMQLRPIQGIIEKFREVKTDDEIRLIDFATKNTRKIIDNIGKFIFEYSHLNLSEIDILRRIRMEIVGLGGVEGFSTIIAYGPNSAKPHHIPINKMFNTQELPLLIDMGYKFGGYSGDISRTFFKSSDKLFEERLRIVEECKNFVLSLIKSGVSFKDLNDGAIDFFKKYRLEDNFIHSIGHGLGLEIHEAPFANSEQSLKPGNVITIEPGLYFPGEYGIRDEDVILITQSGYEILGEDNS
jgi:Xaa-Pro aminopeptidase